MGRIRASHNLLYLGIFCKMSGFSEVNLSQKMGELNQTAPSIQGVSLWLLHHRKHYQNYVKVWYKELGKVKREQKLPMMYLANDLVQNSRKKYPEVSKEFGTVMKAVFVHLSALEFDAKTQASINRLVAIWKERQSFEKRVLSDIDQAWENRNNKADVESQPLTKKPKLSAKESDKSHTDDVRDTSEDIIKVLNSLQAVNNDQSDTAKGILSSLPNLTNITQENIVSQEEGQSML